MKYETEWKYNKTHPIENQQNTTKREKQFNIELIQE